ncbi:unnamed protein product [Amoebophrya sp. A120]|nr:unnamed protein product [Amoebophrya sp. A120]|eukprot:GSA120T00010261001.1
MFLRRPSDRDIDNLNTMAGEDAMMTDSNAHAVPNKRGDEPGRTKELKAKRCKEDTSGDVDMGSCEETTNVTNSSPSAASEGQAAQQLSSSATAKNKAANEVDSDAEDDSELDLEEEDSDEEGIFLDENGNPIENPDKTAASKTKVFRPGQDELAEDEELQYDPNAYQMLHKLNTEWPCLSFDIVQDTLGGARREFPHTCTVVAGSQAQNEKDNCIYVMKWSNLCEQQDESDSDDDSGSESEDEAKSEPKFACRKVQHVGGTVNRIKAMPGAAQGIVATWAENGRVNMWNLAEEFVAVGQEQSSSSTSEMVVKKPIFQSSPSDHKTEGYAMAWNWHKPGEFVSADNDGVLRFWKPREGGWSIDPSSFIGHKKGTAIEDLQFKRKGNGCETVFASCGGDGTVQIYDVRQGKKKSVISLQHSEDGSGYDVNVLDWNPLQGDIIASGADDGSIKVFDIRHATPNAAAAENGDQALMAEFDYHRNAITAIHWHPLDEASLCVASCDQTLSLWDMAVELDEEALKEMHENVEGAEDFPPQLLFLHQGQQDVREAMWHPQIPGMVISTAVDGFNCFKAKDNF